MKAHHLRRTQTLEMGKITVPSSARTEERGRR